MSESVVSYLMSTSIVARLGFKDIVYRFTANRVHTLVTEEEYALITKAIARAVNDEIDFLRNFRGKTFVVAESELAAVTENILTEIGNTRYRRYLKGGFQERFNELLAQSSTD